MRLLCTLLISTVVLTACVTVQEGNAPVMNPEKAAAAHTAIAAQYIRQNNLDAAKRHAEKALKANSRHAPAQNIMGIIFQREGSKSNLMKAEAYFRRAIEYQKDYAQAHNNYGVYLSQLNRNSDAIEQFKIAGSTLGYQGRAAALENLGRIAIKMGKRNLAENSFLQVLDMNKNSLIAKIELIDIFLKKNEYNKAQIFYADYVNFLAGRPQGARSLLQGILIARRIKDVTEFKRLSNNLLENHPDSFEAKRFKRLFPSSEAKWK